MKPRSTTDRTVTLRPAAGISRRRAVATGVALATTVCTSNVVSLAIAEVSTIIPSSGVNARIRVDQSRRRVDAEATSLADVLRALLPKNSPGTRILVDPAVAGRLFDASIVAAPTRSLLDTFVGLASSQLNIHIAPQSVETKVVLLKPAAEVLATRAPSFTGARSHFSCKRCVVEEMSAAFEKHMGVPVLIEPSTLADKVLHDVTVEWVDLPSLRHALNGAAALDASEDVRHVEMWSIRVMPRPLQ